jgi:hypothetical protein
MIRLTITPAAFEAIAVTLQANVGFENQRAGLYGRRQAQVDARPRRKLQ